MRGDDRGPMMGDEGQRGRTRSNEGGRGPMRGEEGQRERMKDNKG